MKKIVPGRNSITNIEYRETQFKSDNKVNAQERNNEIQAV